jgi:hypothetical protein
MLAWLRSLRGKPKEAPVPQAQAAPGGSGEDAYETEEELDRESDPARDLPRIKTDDI